MTEVDIHLLKLLCCLSRPCL